MATGHSFKNPEMIIAICNKAVVAMPQWRPAVKVALLLV